MMIICERGTHRVREEDKFGITEKKKEIPLLSKDPC